MAKRIFLGVGLVFYLMALYLTLFNDPYKDSALFKLVEDNTFNFLYSFLSAVVFAVIGTGFLILFGFWNKKIE